MAILKHTLYSRIVLWYTRAVLPVLLIISPCISSAQAQTWREFDLVSILVEWKVDRLGTLFMNTQDKKFLIYSEMAGDVLMLDANTDSVFTYGNSLLNIDENTNTAEFDLDQDRMYLGQTERVGVDIRLPLIMNKTIYLVPRPEIIGEATIEEILHHKIIFRQLVKTYQPDEAAITYLKEYSTPISVRIVFGSWCGTCRDRIPKIIKVIAKSGNSTISYSFIGVDDKISQDELQERYNVRKLPGITVIKDGVEMGTINNNVSFENGLVSLLQTFE